ncbi:phospholipase A and acyltransferase 1-like [Ruditapes philippinarum]|uniref:phospholipase A and acyltransferase 1-like n=1 Tax=Ruditapes philippinarum TaxID=129788 RepID=UPI00295AE989|nr:phospholipase A and acyltransferase 1-like [Ruditapes philippinarum]
MKLIHIFSISGVPFSKGWVKLDDFWKVAFDSRADKNNKKDQLLTPKPVGEIVNTAKGMLGKIGYNILWNNCEHFASKCRYGTKRSDQVIFGVWCTIGIFAFAVLAKILQDMYNHS